MLILLIKLYGRKIAKEEKEDIREDPSKVSHTLNATKGVKEDIREDSSKVSHTSCVTKGSHQDECLELEKREGTTRKKRPLKAMLRGVPWIAQVKGQL